MKKDIFQRDFFERESHNGTNRAPHIFFLTVMSSHGEKNRIEKGKRWE